MTSDAVDYLMGQPDGANYVVLYQMLCLKTINTDGRLERHIGEIIIPYDEAKIQRDTKWFSIDTIRVAMNLYKALGLIYEDNNGCLALTDHSNLVGSETSWKEQKKLQRAKNLPKLGQCKRLNAQMIRLPSGKTQYVDEKRYGGNGMLAFDLAGGVCEMCGTDQGLLIHHANEYSNDIEDLYVLCKQCHGTAHASGTPSDWLHHTRYGGGQEGGQEGGLVHPDIDIRDRDKRLEKENREVVSVTNVTDRSTADAVEQVVTAWNSYADLKPITKVVPGKQRDTLLRARIREYGLEKILEAIDIIPKCPFLMGDNKNGWTVTFDWFIKPNNFPKVLEGNYLEGSKKTTSNPFRRISVEDW